MASKNVRSKDVSFSQVKYDMATRRLTFVTKGTGRNLVYHGVPADLFYGIPSGTNLDNFIQVKLQGRYSLTIVEPPPWISTSRINRETAVHFVDKVEYYKQEPGDPTVYDDNPEIAWETFQRSYAGRHPSRTEQSQAAALGVPELQPSMESGEE